MAVVSTACWHFNSMPSSKNRLKMKFPGKLKSAFLLIRICFSSDKAHRIAGAK
jgi:hypothetical protein